MTINQFVLIGCGIIVTVTGISSSISKSTNDSLIDSANWIAHTYSVQAHLKELEAMLVNADTGQRGYIITNSEKYLEPYNQAKSHLDNTFLSLQKKIADDPEQLRKLEEIKDLAQQKLKNLSYSIDLKRNKQEKEVLTLFLSDKGKNIMDNIRQKLYEMNQVEEKLLQERQKKEQQIQILATTVYWGNLFCIIIVTITISFAIILIPSRALSRSLEAVFNLAQQIAIGNLTVQVEVTSNDVIGKLMATLKNMINSLNTLIFQVQKSGIEVTSSSTRIAASGKQLEAMMTEQVASTKEVSASAKEISVTSRELLKTMEEVSALSQVTTMAANNSQKDLLRMESIMHQLASATNSIAALLGVMNEKANNINNIVVTITKVADQTNLLSLNAAIEAEKAGESGLGFAVVAREIRRLADQTSVATLSIEQMVKQMQSSVSTGVMEMDKFTKEVGRGVEDVANVSIQMGQIIEQVQSLTPRFETVNQGMSTQSQGAQQISDAMVQLSSTSMQTADSLREINYAIVQLDRASQELRQEILRFQVK